jgi:hypothetical protein
MLGSLVAALNDLNFDVIGYTSVLVSAVATTGYGVSSKILLTGPNRRGKFELVF